MYGERIRFLRKIHKLTQEDLGKKIKLGKSTISQYENEINEPDYATLIEIAKFFNVSTDYILGISEIPNENSPFYNDIQTLVNLFYKMPEERRKNIIKGLQIMIDTENE